MEIGSDVCLCGLGWAPSPGSGVCRGRLWGRPALGFLERGHGDRLEVGKQLLGPSGVVEPPVVAGKLLLFQVSGDGLALDGPGPLDVGAVQGRRIGLAGAAWSPAAHLADHDAARQDPVDIAERGGESLAGRGESQALALLGHLVLASRFAITIHVWSSYSDHAVGKARPGRVDENTNGDSDGFDAGRECFEALVGFLRDEHALSATHGELESALDERGRQLMRQLYQDHLDLRASREQRLDKVKDAKGVPRRDAEAGHRRSLATIFGEVVVDRIAYRRRGEENLHPADGHLNLPEERHSHGLRRLAAIEASRGAFEASQDAIARATGQHLGKRQVEDLARRAATDVAAFYETRRPEASEQADVLVLSCDGKGIVMRPEALREKTRPMGEASRTKLKTRLSKGEPHGRKRMATVGAVYDAVPAPRTATDVLASDAEDQAPAPVARGKWVTASVISDAEVVVAATFDEAERRDPDHKRRWVALVDGNNHQMEAITAEARRRGIQVTVVVDLIHVLEYLWKAVWSFFDEGDGAAEAWVRDRVLAILHGHA